MGHEVALPKQVAEQAQRADEIVAQLNAPVTPTAPNPPAPVEPETPAPAETPAESEATPVKAAPEAPAVSLNDLQQQIQALDNRYKTLQGKYSAEVPTFAARVRELTAENQTLRQIIAEREKAPVQREPAAPAQDPEIEAIRATLGDDVADALAKMSRRDRETYVAAQKDSQTQVATLQRQVEQAARMTFQSQLQAQVPNWDVLNNDEGFLQWLAELDPFAGVKRHDLLLEAAERFDASRVAVFFKTYAATQDPQSKQTVTKPAVRTPSLASQQVAKKAPGTPPVEAKKYTAAEYRAEMNKIAQLIRVDPTKAASLEKELDLAVQEGRVLR